MTKRDRMLILMTGVLFIVLIIKSLYLDPQLGQLNKQEADFVLEVERVLIENEANAWLYTSRLLTSRIIGVDALSDEAIATYEAKLGAQTQTDFRLEYPYKAKVRKYLLWIIPIGQTVIMK